MKLSKETIEVLKNFSAINNSILFKAGKVQRTVAQQKTILAQATIKEELPKEFCIYDLGQFLSVLSLFTDPDITCGDKNLTIKSGQSTTTYFYAAPENITSPPEKKLVLPSVDADFELDGAVLQNALKAAAVLALPEIVLSGRDGTSYIGACDSRVKASNGFEHPTGKATANYRMLFRVENLKLLPRTYRVQLSTKGLAYFKSEAKDLEYWVPTEVSSPSKAAAKE